ncbi:MULTISPECIES: type II toxin-antitoxin system RelE family toxin [Rickettsieae]|uniref:type II toxin-antitoxin system RelE family toxin n=1 Tax=Rickettsieae TaxID=33988 RepID=UPI000B9B7A70|nr:type II toxin-antitoxin system RelE/ParE family toxin [Rickettsia endosymbiont of Culicoides newsteadi]OZG31470.1 addiction module antitoxin RelB [Rickettsia endosymbiont of Culicoides newsteadi]
MYNLLYSDQVIHKDISKLPTLVKSLIKITIEKKLLSDPIKFGKPLKHSLKGCRSLRIGDYRVIYQIIDTTIKILIIQHRKDCYNH